jgi:predicted nucleic acid-binding protein
MNAVFCDTSGLYALLMPNDDAHSRAASAWEKLLAGEHRLVTTNYVVLEVITLVQMRYSLAAAQRLNSMIEEFLDTHVLSSVLHERALSDLFYYDRRALSLVDCSSFVFMRQHRIETAFAYDGHFKEHGFALFS